MEPRLVANNEFDFDAEVNQPFRDAYETGLPWVRASRTAKSVLTDCYSANPELTIAYLRILVPRVCEELRRGGSIDPFLPEINRRVIELRQAPPSPTPDTEIARVAPVLVSESGCNWASIEVDFLRQWLRMGERLVRYDRWGVETDSHRAVTRAELRSSMRPVTWKNDLSWESQFDGHDIPAKRGELEVVNRK